MEEGKGDRPCCACMFQLQGLGFFSETYSNIQINVSPSEASVAVATCQGLILDISGGGLVMLKRAF